ncbi:MAG: tetratricopeptide repeat protein, partial [Synechococcaceae cyanobacterium]
MPGSAFAIEQARQAEARQLPGFCHQDFLRLSRSLIHGPPFQWLLVDAPDEGLRRRVMAALDRVLRRAGLRSNRLPLSDKISDVPMLEARLVKLASSAEVVHVIGRQGWFDAARWDAFNARRERLAANARARWVFWLDAEAIEKLSGAAPDLWAWRGGVYAFVPPPVVESTGNLYWGGDMMMPSLAELRGALLGVDHRSMAELGADHRSMAECGRRVAEIRTWLDSNPDAPDELKQAPLDELGGLLFRLGDLDGALRHWRQDLVPLLERLGDARARANAMGRIADILELRGQLEEALRLRREEQLPVYERLGDRRSWAIAIGHIADILQIQGHLDEALRLRQEQEV